MGAKREIVDRPSWDEYFMTHAVLAASRASCQYVTAGAVIVKDKRIIATGYNGAPPGIGNCLEKGCRKERVGIEFETKGTGNCIGEHAERNALLQVPRNMTLGAEMYSALFPCSDCAKQIVGAGISRLVYLNHYKEPSSLTKELMEGAGVQIEQMALDIDKMFKFLKGVAVPRT